MASLADGRRVDVLRRAEEEVDASAQGGGKNSIEAFDALWVRTGLVRYSSGTRAVWPTSTVVSAPPASKTASEVHTRSQP